MAKTKKNKNARVAGRRKQTKESAAEKLCMDNIPMGLNESDDSSVLDIKKTSLCEHRCQVTKFLQNLNFS